MTIAYFRNLDTLEGMPRFLVVVLLVLALIPVPAALTQEVEEAAYTFVSVPDFLNADVGTVRRSRRWDNGDPNSINASYRGAVDVILDAIEAEGPDSVLVAGDLVEGHWGIDEDDTGIFGPVKTFAQKNRAVTRAGNLYYRQWARRFAQRDLPVFPAVGDHEIGDNPWPARRFKYRAMPVFKSVWAKHFTDSGSAYAMRPRGTRWEDTAYATYLRPELLLVTVDVFARSRDGVHAKVVRGQLRWLDDVLAHNTALGDGGAKWVIVQGHTPVLGPVRMARSSGLYTENGEAFWDTMQRHDVTAYFNGEVHTVTLRHDGVTQISHGNGIVAGIGDFNYLVGTVYDDRIEITIKRIPRLSTDNTVELWQTSRKRPPISVTYERESHVSGTAVLTEDGGRIDEFTGELIPVDGVLVDG